MRRGLARGVAALGTLLHQAHFFLDCGNKLISWQVRVVFYPVTAGNDPGASQVALGEQLSGVYRGLFRGPRGINLRSHYEPKNKDKLLPGYPGGDETVCADQSRAELVNSG